MNPIVSAYTVSFMLFIGFIGAVVGNIFYFKYYLHGVKERGKMAYWNGVLEVREKVSKYIAKHPGATDEQVSKYVNRLTSRLHKDLAEKSENL